MSVKYFDICDHAYKRDSDNREVYILRVDKVGNVYEDIPTEYESQRFDRHWNYDARVISKEIAYALAKNPGLSYSGDHIMIFNERNKKWE